MPGRPTPPAALTPAPPPLDAIDETSEESFPASDAPSWTGVTGADGFDPPQSPPSARPRPSRPAKKPRPAKRAVADAKRKRPVKPAGRRRKPRAKR